MWVSLSQFPELGDSKIIVWDCGYGLTEDRGIIDQRLRLLQSSVEIAPFL